MMMSRRLLCYVKEYEQNTAFFPTPHPLLKNAIMLNAMGRYDILITFFFYLYFTLLCLWLKIKIITGQAVPGDEPSDTESHCYLWKQLSDEQMKVRWLQTGLTSSYLDGCSSHLSTPWKDGRALETWIMPPSAALEWLRPNSCSHILVISMVMYRILFLQ